MCQVSVLRRCKCCQGWWRCSGGTAWRARPTLPITSSSTPPLSSHILTPSSTWSSLADARTHSDCRLSYINRFYFIRGSLCVEGNHQIFLCQSCNMRNETKIDTNDKVFSIKDFSRSFPYFGSISYFCPSHNYFYWKKQTYFRFNNFSINL